ncbi:MULTISPECIES: tRNA guanosine(15) transglycosylase TgtA [unclassified Methanobrevibacter]|jgi:7-cyano-7-deazaguanine tRNA-ribosyltransferase|uniref:tRNA guanosine(15) transglycosylase TgtA n=1 Tax=unclassified Methanobrevibacter TaxID=2638681 RepID=UPI0039B92E8F
MFEIKAKDNRGRVGVLKTQHGKVMTPALMPVIHPRKQTIDVKKYGADIVITNAYLIYKDPKLKQKALDEGLHKLIDFQGPVMTDSGSFQLSVYGDVDIGNTEVVDFQEQIGSDIGTSLDIPTAPYVDKEEAQKDMEITIKRAQEAIEYRNNKKYNLKLNSVVQGSTFTDLRSECADRLTSLNADLYPIGAVVPLMEGYDYKNLVDVVMASVKNLPDSKPRHLMGAGHPMVFALCAAMGCDLFDSAAYILYAEDDRLLTTTGTIKLENLHEMPCSCEVCSKYTPDELRKLPKKERVELIAAHNLHVSFAELRRIRQAIYEGTLMELVELRCRAHPALLDAVRELGNYSEDLEKYDPSVKKSAFFYTGPESLKRATVTRHLEKLRNQPKKKDLIILGGGRKPYSKYYQGRLGRFHTLTGSQKQVNPEEADFMVLDIPFGLTPLDLDETYPLAQNVAPKILDDDSIEFLINTLAEFSEYYNQVLIHARPVREYGLDLPEYEHSHDIRFKKDDTRKIKAIANYQFQSNIGEQLFDGDLNIEKSKKTGKIRHIYDGEELIANMRASDANFVLSDEGAKRLHKNINYPNNRIVVDSSVEEFARDGKSVFSKFVVDIDPNIRAQDEVLITNSNDDLLAYGKVLLNPKEINDFNTGQAVKVRKGFKL